LISICYAFEIVKLEVFVLLGILGLFLILSFYLVLRKNNKALLWALHSRFLFQTPRPLLVTCYFHGLGPWSSPLSLYRNTTPNKITIGVGKGVCVVHNLEQSLAGDGSKNFGVTCKLVLDFLKFQCLHGPSLSSSSLETINKNKGDRYLARFSFR
jgi:hypothetical protein